MGDALTFNMENLFPDTLRREWEAEVPDIRVIGNLPFNISTPLIIKYLKVTKFTDMAIIYPDIWIYIILYPVSIFPDIRVIGNLPFNISTPLIITYLKVTVF